MTDDAEQPNALYRMFNDGGDLLYVGISLQPFSRAEQHAREKQWWTEVATVRLTWFASRPEAEAAERVAIKSELPRHNVVHSNSSEARQKRARNKRPMDFGGHHPLNFSNKGDCPMGCLVPGGLPVEVLSAGGIFTATYRCMNCRWEWSREFTADEMTFQPPGWPV